MHTLHTPVLLDEVKNAFVSLKNGDFLDATLGFGGHSSAILKVHSSLNLIACDQDEFALNSSKKRLAEFSDRTRFFHCNFSQVLSKFDSLNLVGILADIGLSSLQLDSNERGFSFESDFLDMRMNKAGDLSAKDIINSYSKADLIRIFKDFGELRNAKFLAEKICKARELEEIKSAKELCKIIGKSQVFNRHVSVATLVFQALRIEVNKELDVLKDFLKQLENLRLKNCILAIICFHSLEDRIVKDYFKKWAKNCICDENAMRCECGKNHALGEIINKKPIVPSKAEISLNSRSSCAKMRVFHFKNLDL